MKTVLYKDIFTSDECLAMYEYLKENIDWEDGVPSRINGFTRKAKSLFPDEDIIV